MKKFIAIFAIIATFGFVACNNAPDTEASGEDTTPVAEQVEATAEVEATSDSATLAAAAQAKADSIAAATKK